MHWPRRDDERRMGGGGGLRFCRSAQPFCADCSRYWPGFKTTPSRDENNTHRSQTDYKTRFVAEMTTTIYGPDILQNIGLPWWAFQACHCSSANDIFIFIRQMVVLFQWVWLRYFRLRHQRVANSKVQSTCVTLNFDHFARKRYISYTRERIFPPNLQFLSPHVLDLGTRTGQKDR